MARRPHRSKQAQLLFSALLAQGGEYCHGYALMQQTGLKSGTLYPLLMRLSDDALVESKWIAPDADNPKPRHSYRLTPKGAGFARALLAEKTTEVRLNPGFAT